ncbi:hypothetical protein JJB99_23380 [Bradyrhizobium diazoefficiens]|uniref:hypothetical protein n=1 Tax=Bradyrhizobium diazoefficiens TaxID=1355477 RepID=UPI00190CBF6D|nr:hypothetical protein [Bradyrhizobium diazoefficiens]QQO12415.1 hypothetical protein JJB99_23380 [Bradyrhizobium diazoefficiens]
MGSLVFVHGIGSRKTTDGSEHPYDVTFRAIGWELFRKKIEWTLVKCQWGDDLGAKLHASGKSFPTYDGRLAVSAEPDDPLGIWRVLLEDPTFELRALVTMAQSGAKSGAPAVAGPPGSAAAGPPGGAIPASVVLQTRLAAGLAPTGPLLVLLKDSGLEACFAEAVAKVRAAPETPGATSHPQAFRALARAIVAQTVRRGMDLGIPPPGGADLQVMVDRTEELLHAGQLFGVTDWAKKALAGWLTNKGARERAALLGAATPLAGDVIVYQAHGDLVRNRIREVVSAAAEPIAILAHSLGGVAATEALVEDASMRSRVRKLITAGSQPGFFYEIDALRTLPYGTKLPTNFPDWLSFWDPRDFLSFKIDGVFTGGGTRRDTRVDSELPFPASHSGYWRQSSMWEEVRDFLKEV